MKTWKVIFNNVSMCAEHEETVDVEANTERKAIIFAEKEMQKRGFRYFEVESIKEVK